MISKVVKNFLNFLSVEISKANLEDALALARLYGNIAWNNPVNSYEANEIESTIYRQLAQLKSEFPVGSKATKNGKILHVLTEGYTSGGHTRVLERLLKVHGSFPKQDLVIVEICPDEVISKLSATGLAVTRIASTGSQAIAELSAIMTMYSSVVLHIHPDDIVSSLAARIARESGTKVALYNHSDHCFTFGMNSVDILCEISVYGRTISEKYRPELPWSFAGIPLDINVATRKSSEVKDYILSSGPAYKFDFNEGSIFSTIVETLVGTLAIKMIIIGPGELPQTASKSLLHLVRMGNLIILPAVAHGVYAEYLRSCICYLDSTPITGGSALPEAALLGVPCVGMESAIMGYSPIDVIRSKTVADLIFRVKQLNGNQAGAADFDRATLLNAHTPALVADRILSSLQQGTCINIPYIINTESINIEYFHEQWKAKEILHINNRAFDYISVPQRLTLFFSMLKFGVFKSMSFIGIAKIFISNINSRRRRNR